MTRILALDTSSDACSVALLTDEEVKEDFRLTPREHTKLILPMIDALLAEAGLKLSDLDAIAFGRGPGSFTGLRIAAGIVQGLAWGAELPVVAVSTLEAMARDAADKHNRQWVLTVLDARMDEVYAGLYQVQAGEPQARIPERVCAPERLEDVASQVQGPLAVVGSGLVYEARFPQALQQLIEVRDPDLQPRAAAIAQLAQVYFQRGETLTPEQVQPIYLRDEVAWKKLPGR